MKDKIIQILTIQESILGLSESGKLYKLYGKKSKHKWMEFIDSPEINSDNYIELRLLKMIKKVKIDGYSIRGIKITPEDMFELNYRTSKSELPNNFVGYPLAIAKVTMIEYD